MTYPLEINFSEGDGIEKIKSYLILLNEQLAFMMSNLDSDNFSESVNDSLLSAVSAKKSAEVLEKRVGSLESGYSSVALSEDKIEWLVAGEDEASFTLTDSAARVVAQRISLEGAVFMSDLSGEGRSVINGANIMTGTVNADKIDAYDLAAVSARIGGFDLDVYSFSASSPNGAISFSSASSADPCWISAEDGNGDMTFAVYKNGNCYIKGDFISEGSVSASKIVSDSESLLDLRNDDKGISIGRLVAFHHSNNTRKLFVNLSGDLVFDTGGNSFFTLKLDRNGNAYTFSLCDGGGNRIGTVPVNYS